jgi:type IV pilus assembly protein PilO
MMSNTHFLQSDRRLRGQGITSVFIGLNPNDPTQWPVLPRSLLCVACGLAVVAAMWLGWLGAVVASFEAEQVRQELLRHDFRQKLRQSANHGWLKQLHEQEQQRMAQLERQLPTAAEMDAVLGDIHRAGVARGLQYELLRPGQVIPHGYLSEWPLALRVSGRYHSIGLLAADIARLSHTVTLSKLSLKPAKDRPGLLTLECTARLFRLPDPQERAVVQQAAERKP